MEDTTPHDIFVQLKRLLIADTRSESVIARAAGVSQPSVSRYKHGTERYRWGKSFIRLCNFYGIAVQPSGQEHNEYERQLRDAIIDVWDGSDNQADALLELLRNLKQITINSSPGARNG
ncbi:XRE family transcriptional regulator [Caballeronia sp. 15711]|uniref:XRE family transcriptional regulator n=1 Tax=Caballeronia sp. 15711 TaxID=3391029 RepID=UPI0039E6A6F2